MFLWIGIVFISALLLRIPTLREPMHGDFGAHLYYAQRRRDGLRLYVDVPCGKPPMTYWLYSLAYLLGFRSVAGIRLFLAGWHGLVAISVYALAHVWSGDSWVALGAGLAYGILSAEPRFRGHFSHPENFMMLPMTLGLLSFSLFLKHGHGSLACAAGMMCGAAYLCKQSVAPNILLLFAWLLFPEKDIGAAILFLTGLGSSLLAALMALGPRKLSDLWAYLKLLAYENLIWPLEKKSYVVPEGTTDWYDTAMEKRLHLDRRLRGLGVYDVYHSHYQNYAAGNEFIANLAFFLGRQRILYPPMSLEKVNPMYFDAKGQPLENPTWARGVKKYIESSKRSWSSDLAAIRRNIGPVFSLGIGVWLAALAFLGMATSELEWLLALWATAALLAVMAQRRYGANHLLPILPPAAVMASLVLIPTIGEMGSPLNAGETLILLGLVGWLVYLAISWVSLYIGKGRYGSLYKLWGNWAQILIANEKIGKYFQKNTPASQKVLQFGDEAAIYYYANRQAAGDTMHWIYPEPPPDYQGRFISAVEKDQPRFIAFMGPDFGSVRGLMKTAPLPYIPDRIFLWRFPVFRLAKAGDTVDFEWADETNRPKDRAASIAKKVSQVRAVADSGGLEEAIRGLTLLLKEESDNAALWNDLGVVLWRLGMQEHARENFARALRRDPNLEVAADNLFKSSWELGQEKEAAPLFQSLAMEDITRKGDWTRTDPSVESPVASWKPQRTAT